MPLWWFHWPKTPNNFFNIFFILNYTTPLAITGFEHFPSSIRCQVMVGQGFSWRANHAFCENVWIRPKTGFLTHTFCYKYASKSIKGYIDADFNLVLTKLYDKIMAQWVGAQGRPNLANIFKTGLLWNVTIRNRPSENEKYFISILTTRLAESVDFLDISLAQSLGELEDCSVL